MYTISFFLILKSKSQQSVINSLFKNFRKWNQKKNLNKILYCNRDTGKKICSICISDKDSPLSIHLLLCLLDREKGRQRRRADAYTCAQSLFFIFYTTPVCDRFVLVHFSFTIKSSLRDRRGEDRIAHNPANVQ